MDIIGLIGDILEGLFGTPLQPADAAHTWALEPDDANWDLEAQTTTWEVGQT